MTKLINRLWAGQVPLGEAVWTYAVAYGFVINAISHGLLLALLVNDMGLVLVAVAFILPIPYNLLIVVAVWRSAERYEGPKKWADLALVGTVIWMIILTAA